MIIALKISLTDPDDQLARWRQNLTGIEPSRILLLIEDGESRELPPADHRITFRRHFNSFPQDDNAVFQETAAHARDVLRESFLYVQCNSAVLGPDWFQKIEAEYHRARKPYMGDIVHIPNFTDPTMAPVGVYPGDLIATGGGEAMYANELPWMLFIPIAKVHKTPLIRHAWEDATRESLGGCLLAHPERSAFMNLPSVPVLAEVTNKGESFNIVESERGESHESSEQSDQAPESTKAGQKAPGGDGKAKHVTGGAGQTTSEPESAGDPPFGDRPTEIPFVPQTVSDILKETAFPPWKSTTDSVQRIRFLCDTLSTFCNAPSHTRIVREELAYVGVIKGPKGTRNRKNLGKRRRKRLRSISGVQL